jgi:hypothetical protein
MPRKRRKRDKRKKTEKSEPVPSPQAMSIEETLEGYSVDNMRKFTNVGEDSYITMYEVPTPHIGDEETMKTYRSQMITALQSLGKRKGVIISVQHIKFGVFPNGENSIIKAYAFKKDTPKGRMEIAKKAKDAMSGTDFDWEVGNEAKSRFTR